MQRPKSNPLSPSVKNLFYFSWQIGLEGADMGLRELAAGQSWIIVLKPRIRYIYWSLEPYSSLSCACIMQIWQIGKEWRRSWVWNGAESDWGWRLIGEQVIVCHLQTRSQNKMATTRDTWKGLQTSLPEKAYTLDHDKIITTDLSYYPNQDIIYVAVMCSWM